MRIPRWMRALLVVAALGQLMPTFALAGEGLTWGRYKMSVVSECVDTLTGKPIPMGGGVARTSARPSVARFSTGYARSVGAAQKLRPMTSALTPAN